MLYYAQKTKNIRNLQSLVIRSTSVFSR